MAALSDPSNRRTKPRLPSLWSAGAALIALVVVAPILAVVWIALAPSVAALTGQGEGASVWAQLWATTLPRYLRTTLILMFGVGALTALMGTGAAWLVARYHFPGSRWIQWALLMPLAVPAYVGAYALVDFLEYAGPVQTFLRGLMGWTSARDYWFPEIRSLGGAAAGVLRFACLRPVSRPHKGAPRGRFVPRFP